MPYVRCTYEQYRNPGYHRRHCAPGSPLGLFAFVNSHAFGPVIVGEVLDLLPYLNVHAYGPVDDDTTVEGGPYDNVHAFGPVDAGVEQTVGPNAPYDNVHAYGPIDVGADETLDLVSFDNAHAYGAVDVALEVGPLAPFDNVHAYDSYFYIGGQVAVRLVSPSGRVVWSDTGATAFDITVDHEGNALACGWLADRTVRKWAPGSNVPVWSNTDATANLLRIAVDDVGDCYVGDQDAHLVKINGQTGVTEWTVDETDGITGWFNNYFVDEVEVYEDHVYCCTYNGPQQFIHKITLDGEHVTTIQKERAAGGFTLQRGYLYVVEANGVDAVQIRKLDLDLSEVWDTTLSGATPLNVNDIAVDSADNVYAIANFSGNVCKVYKLNSSGVEQYAEPSTAVEQLNEIRWTTRGELWVSRAVSDPEMRILDPATGTQIRGIEIDGDPTVERFSLRKTNVRAYARALEVGPLAPFDNAHAYAGVAVALAVGPLSAYSNAHAYGSVAVSSSPIGALSPLHWWQFAELAYNPVNDYGSAGVDVTLSVVAGSGGVLDVTNVAPVGDIDNAWRIEDSDPSGATAAGALSTTATAAFAPSLDTDWSAVIFDRTLVYGENANVCFYGTEFVAPTYYPSVIETFTYLLGTSTTPTATLPTTPDAGDLLVMVIGDDGQNVVDVSGLDGWTQIVGLHVGNPGVFVKDSVGTETDWSPTLSAAPGSACNALYMRIAAGTWDDSGTLADAVKWAGENIISGWTWDSPSLDTGADTKWLEVAGYGWGVSAGGATYLAPTLPSGFGNLLTHGSSGSDTRVVIAYRETEAQVLDPGSGTINISEDALFSWKRDYTIAIKGTGPSVDAMDFYIGRGNNGLPLVGFRAVDDNSSIEVGPSATPPADKTEWSMIAATYDADGGVGGDGLTTVRLYTASGEKFEYEHDHVGDGGIRPFGDVIAPATAEFYVGAFTFDDQIDQYMTHHAWFGSVLAETTLDDIARWGLDWAPLAGDQFLSPYGNAQTFGAVEVDKTVVPLLGTFANSHAYGAVDAEVASYPTIASRSTELFASAVNWAVTWPTVADGDLLILAQSCNATNALNGPSGWTKLGESASHIPDELAVFAYVCDGTETGTFDLPAGSDPGTVLIYRIAAGTYYAGYTTLDDGTAIEIDFSESAGTGQPDPPSITAGWGSAQNLSIVLSAMGNGFLTLTSPPSGWSNAVSISHGSASAPTTVGGADRDYEGATLDPGAFTWSNNNGWIAAHLFVRPA